MSKPYLHLGDYFQLLAREGLIASGYSTPLPLAHPISAVEYDSRKVKANTLFLCKGANFKEEYLATAQEKRATAYVSEVVYPKIHLPCILVTDIRKAVGLLADLSFGHPSAGLRVTGITGTKGKTTTAYYMKSVLDLWQREKGRERSTAMLSTIITDDGVERAPAVLTTPEPLELQRHLYRAKSAGCQYLTMEVSSQALKYGRTVGVDLDCAVFLNLGEDHVSPIEHPNAEDYFQSKCQIFAQSKVACVNLDSDRSEEVLAAAQCCERLITFSRTNPSATIYANEGRRLGNEIRFHVTAPTFEGELALSIAGLFNIENALAVVAVCYHYGVPFATIQKGLKDAFVPGRMERYYSTDGQLAVVVDFAHNAMSLERVLQSVGEEYTGRPITLVFGCVGGKALDRRDGLAKVSATYAQHIFLTEDDPGPERVADICAHVTRYIEKYGNHAVTLVNREEAIRTAILMAPRPSIIVVAGKGEETIQKHKSGYQPCRADGVIVKEVLAEYNQG